MNWVIRSENLICAGLEGTTEYCVFLRTPKADGMIYLDSLFNMPRGLKIEIMREWDEIAEIVFEEEAKRMKV